NSESNGRSDARLTASERAAHRSVARARGARPVRSEGEERPDAELRGGVACRRRDAPEFLPGVAAAARQGAHVQGAAGGRRAHARDLRGVRSEEHTSELQSRENLVCRLLLEKKKNLRYHIATQ